MIVYQTMARTCELCGKSTQVGHRVSHAKNITLRKVKPNLRRVKVVVGGRSKTMKICTKCLKSKIKVEVRK